MEAIAAAVLHLFMVAEEQFQSVTDGREGYVGPGDIFLGEQLDFQAFDAGLVIEVQQRGPIEHIR